MTKTQQLRAALEKLGFKKVETKSQRDCLRGYDVKGSDVYVFLNETGGLVDQTGTVRSAVNLTEDFFDLTQDGVLDVESRRKLIEINTLLNELPPTSSVSITSPDHLAKELFTHGGHGTFVRRGEKVQRHEDWASIDVARLRELLEACFGRRLDEKFQALLESLRWVRENVSADNLAGAAQKTHDVVEYAQDACSPRTAAAVGKKLARVRQRLDGARRTVD